MAFRRRSASFRIAGPLVDGRMLPSDTVKDRSRSRMRTEVAVGRTRVLWTVLFAAILVAEPALAQARPAGRILGVFDEMSLQPIVGAEVVDLGTGIKALTSETGTISLGHLVAGTTMLHVRRIGYESKIVPVTVAPSDTVSITVVLTPRLPTLPTVVTTERPSPADPKWKLGVVGFLDRQRTISAPPAAFVTAEQIARWHLSLLSDLKSHTGRGVCGDVYIDGVHQDMTSLAYGSGNYRKGVDELIRPENVAGVEIYTASEAPYPYFQPEPPLVISRVNGRRVAPTAAGGARRSPTTNSGCAVTLIWSR